MTQPSKIPLAFAASGDKNTIPESTETTGLASWREGFPAITSAPFSEGGIAPKRADFNGIFYALSQAVMWLQQGGVYAYDATTDYEVGNIVEYSGDLYKCITANGPSSAVKAPTDTTVWDAIATASGYLPLSGGTLTGALYTNDIYVDNSAIRSKADTQATIIYGGVGWAHGAQISACGKNESVNPGAFILRADNGNDFANLIGRPDGELSWQKIPLLNNGNFTKMFFSQTSGTYIAPYTGVYRVTLKGGGGGGSGGDTGRGGNGGAEGGIVQFYETLTKGTSYAYVIGAGGSAGSAGADGGNGGNSTMTVSGTTYTANGGYGGMHDAITPAGGGGTPSTAYIIQGAAGQGGTQAIGGGGATRAYVLGGSGGGNGGGTTGKRTGGAGIKGGGGGGGSVFGSTTYAGGAGGAGYILIEYAG